MPHADRSPRRRTIISIDIRLSGSDSEAAESDAAALLRDYAECEPERQIVSSTDSITRDPATIIAMASLILSVPGAVLATLQAIDLAKRNRLRKQINVLKATLASTGCEGRLTKEGVGTIDLVRDSADSVMDLLLSEDQK